MSFAYLCLLLRLVLEDELPLVVDRESDHGLALLWLVHAHVVLNQRKIVQDLRCQH